MKVAVKLGDLQANPTLSELVVVHFFRAISSIWSKSAIIQYIKEAEANAGIERSQSEITYSLVPLLTYSKLPVSSISVERCCQGCFCDKGLKSELSENCPCHSQLSRNKLKSLLPVAEQQKRICWATKEEVTTLYKAIDRSLRVSKATWQCIEEFAVSVVEIDHEQLEYLSANSKSFKLPPGCRVKKFRLMLPDPKFYSTLFDVFLTMNASSLVGCLLIQPLDFEYFKRFSMSCIPECPSSPISEIISIAAVFWKIMVANKDLLPNSISPNSGLKLAQFNQRVRDCLTARWAEVLTRKAQSLSNAMKHRN